jgi:DNA-binding transcriptional MerR regulator
MKKYTRGEICKALGIPKTTLRRWEESGKVKPTKNERGVRLYSEADVRKLANTLKVSTLEKARAVLPEPAKADGELAAKIFAALDRGVSPVKVVIDLGVHPDVVEAFHAQQTRMNRVVLVSQKTLVEISGCPGFVGSYPIETEEELLEAFQASIKDSICPRCRRRHATVCFRCSKEEVERIRAETEARVRAEYANGRAGNVRPFPGLSPREVGPAARKGTPTTPPLDASTTRPSRPGSGARDDSRGRGPRPNGPGSDEVPAE